MSSIHPLLIDLAERTATLIVLAFFLSRFRFFRRVLRRTDGPRDKIITTIICTLIGIYGTYAAIPIEGALANSRVIGPVMAGLLGGPIVGTAAGFLAGLHRYFLGGFTDLACAVSTTVEGALAGLVYMRYHHRSIHWKMAWVVGFIAEGIQMLLILGIARPFADALHLVEIIALPMMLVNASGIALFVMIVQTAKAEEEKIGSMQAQRALQIADITLPILRQGLNETSAEKTARVIYNMTEAAAVAITDREKILAHIGAGDKHHQRGTPLQTEATLKAIHTQQLLWAKNKTEIGCSSIDCPLHSAIIVPLRKKDTVVGTLKLYFKKQHEVSVVDWELARGLAQLFSTQLEIADLEKQAALLADAEIRALHAQINPHFLFNALNTISSFIRTKPETARRLIVNLAEFFRRNLHQGDRIITVEEEIKHVEAYLEIEKARFGDKLQIVTEIQPEAWKQRIPGLILQPIVENAVKHGLLPKKAGGTILIRIGKENNALVIQVIDDGVGFAASTESRPFSGIGLQNVRGRLQSLYGNPYDLTIEANPGGGTVCTITIPWKERNVS
ncbi:MULTISPECIES: sensor histidine kinase [Aneurinibacillus]|uniref:histidine kinase n=1 Tax=Aneurinibacillus thermoaerophilus TaxID=143495 RepID=A0A1G7Z8H7_ANETH|nr:MULTISPECIES: sensor histidine kinase [Aneurinibacillus]AMA72296.1 histidine kinase [Aneurinibacillus sp. XH2]MED0735835.1 sensor histidine kinase [Aneurinibacillus thermoaerophilus]MED0758495.1 sensor histidine kinase [Aneurinibacillus thermoaerophilus]MED0762209.1 sensor histidine kinase [Aneurinibacillus thermoaerophilus]QYY41947.1 sensor histidine kinase [Aneurinibacillus thermoaerophilus]